MNICKKCGAEAEIMNFDLTEMLCNECNYNFVEWSEKNKGVLFAEFLNV